MEVLRLCWDVVGGVSAGLLGRSNEMGRDDGQIQDEQSQ